MVKSAKSRCTFFSDDSATPTWLLNKISRRKVLKSAAGASALAMIPARVWSTTLENAFVQAKKTDPWLTLDAVLVHLLPTSDSGPDAKDIQALQYLYNVVNQQPTAQDEIDFIFKGVGWLNDFSQQQHQQNFIELTTEQKEKLLRAISRSTAGENWLNNLIGYIFEAMLSPPSYGGNPNGIGWQWLGHQAGFPLPKVGQRYFELPLIATKPISSATTQPMATAIDPRSTKKA